MSRLLQGGKRKLSVVISTAILTMSLSYIVASASVTTSNNVNFRTTPELSTENIICKLQKNDEVKILDVSNGWLKVEIDGVVGYVYSDYVNEQSNATVIDNGVRARTSATVDANNIYTKFNKNARVNVIDVEGDFYAIVKDGKKLFVHNSLLKVDEGIAFGNSEVVTDEQVQEAEENQILNSTNGVITTDNVRVRKSDNTSSQVVIRLNKGDRVKFINKSKNGWYSFLYNNETVWVCGEYVNLDNEVVLEEIIIENEVVPASISANETLDAEVAQESVEEKEELDKSLEVGDTVFSMVSNLNFRNQMNLEQDSIMFKLVAGTELDVVEIYEDWLQVKTEKEEVGYVSREYVSKSEVQAQLVEYAKKFIGVPYVYGGTTPNGFDCSGYMQYVYKHFGIEIPRVARDQARASNGYTISKEDLMPGDLIFFITKGNYISHVGMYIGNNEFLHAPDVGQTITVANMTDSYWIRRYAKSVRIKY